MYWSVCICLHQSPSPSSSSFSGVMEYGVQLGVHQPLVVRVSIKAHQPVHLQFPAPGIRPPAAVDSDVSPSRSPSVVHTEGETLVVVGGRDGLVFEGRGEVPVDAKRRAEGRVKRRTI